LPNDQYRIDRKIERQEDDAVTWSTVCALLERRERYRSLFTGHEDGSLVKDIRDAVNKGLALGSDRFKDEIETNFKRRVRPAKMGRPRNPTDSNHEQKQKSLR